MTAVLTRADLEALVKGSQPYYSHFNYPLVVKAGHSYSDQYGRTYWNNLDRLTDSELWQLRTLCAESWLNHNF